MPNTNSFNIISNEIKSLCQIGIENWRIKSKIEKSKSELSFESIKSISLSLDKIELILKEAGIEIEDLTSKKYSDGLNVDVLSFNKSDGKKSVIAETLEPAVKYKGKIIKRAKVIVTK